MNRRFARSAVKLSCKSDVTMEYQTELENKIGEVALKTLHDEIEGGRITKDQLKRMALKMGLSVHGVFKENFNKKSADIFKLMLDEWYKKILFKPENDSIQSLINVLESSGLSFLAQTIKTKKERNVEVFSQDNTRAYLVNIFNKINQLEKDSVNQKEQLDQIFKNIAEIKSETTELSKTVKEIETEERKLYCNVGDLNKKVDASLQKLEAKVVELESDGKTLEKQFSERAVYLLDSLKDAVQSVFGKIDQKNQDKIKYLENVIYDDEEEGQSLFSMICCCCYKNIKSSKANIETVPVGNSTELIISSYAQTLNEKKEEWRRRESNLSIGSLGSLGSSSVCTKVTIDNENGKTMLETPDNEVVLHVMSKAFDRSYSNSILNENDEAESMKM